MSIAKQPDAGLSPLATAYLLTGDRFLADGHMQRARNFTGLVRLERGLLEGADARHGPIKVSQAAGRSRPLVASAVPHAREI